MLACFQRWQAALLSYRCNMTTILIFMLTTYQAISSHMEHASLSNHARSFDSSQARRSKHSNSRRYKDARLLQITQVGLSLPSGEHST